jgi:pSer/pThr/pTyr-binding forkhead associated (FHA) protein
VVTRTYANRTFQLAYGNYRVGTQETCDIVIVDPWVSREHLEVEVSAHGVRVVDLGSTNGSFCNGEGFEDLVVLPGSAIAIGGSLLRIRLVVSPRPSQAPLSRVPTQPGPAVAPTPTPFFPRPRFAAGSIQPAHASWGRPPTPGPDILPAQPAVSGEVLPHTIDWAAPRRSRMFLRCIVALFVTSVIAACVVVAFPPVLDPLCDDYEWFGAEAAGVVRQLAYDARSTIAELM